VLYLVLANKNRRFSAITKIGEPNLVVIQKKMRLKKGGRLTISHITSGTSAAIRTISLKACGKS